MYLFCAHSQSWHYTPVAVPSEMPCSHIMLKAGNQQQRKVLKNVGTSVVTEEGALPVFIPVRHVTAIIDMPASCLLGDHHKVPPQAVLPKNAAVPPVAHGAVTAITESSGIKDTSAQRPGMMMRGGVRQPVPRSCWSEAERFASVSVQCSVGFGPCP
jgi:hypothetical protein